MPEVGERVGAPVVTLFESYGSGAEHVGAWVAQALGLPFHEQAFSSPQLEENARLREKEGLLARALGAMSHSSFGGVDVGDVASGQRDNYDLVMANTATVQRWARQGGVIVGRNGAFILADWPAALHVKLDGPLDQRIARAAQEAGISPERAARRQKNEDRIRADMSIALYGWDPRDPIRYDLVLNTGRMDPETCVEIIVQASRIKGDRGSRSAS
jgi:cytidylate kinase